MRILAIVLIPCLVGCMSIGYRTDGSCRKKVMPGIYPATRCDVDVMGRCFQEPPAAGPTQAFEDFQLLVFSLALLDMPLAFALDTILLPFDAFNKGKDKIDE